MKLLVVSDSHGDQRALEAAVDQNPEASAVIYLGDGMRDIEALQEERPSLRIYAVRGNCDFASFAALEGLAPFAGTLVFYTHGHIYDVKSGLERLAAAAAARGAGVALFGHTHEPTLREVGGVWLFNPGSVSTYAGRGSFGVLTLGAGAPVFTRGTLRG